MTQQRVRKRCNCIEDILNDKHLWVLSAQEFNPRNEFKRVFNQNNCYVYELLNIFLNDEVAGDQSLNKKRKS